ncbi:MAG: hypothetical protein AMXMBFR13_27930 [Phycisphaerae bacterium]
MSEAPAFKPDDPQPEIGLIARLRQYARPTLGQLAETFLEIHYLKAGPKRRTFYGKHLKKFLELHAAKPARAITSTHVQDLQTTLLAKGYKPKTINHDVSSVRTLLLWADEHQLVNVPGLRAIKKLPLDPAISRAQSPDFVREWILSCPDDNLRAWLAITYLCALRLPEAVNVVCGIRRWASHGVLLVPHKMRNIQRVFRHVLFSREAFHWLQLARPTWTTYDTYSRAVCRVMGMGPSFLRASAITHLRKAGVPIEEVELAVGHYRNDVIRSYDRIDWPRLRLRMKKLTLKLEA